MSRGSLAAQKGSFQVDGEYPIPFLFRQVDDRYTVPGCAGACVVDQNVNSSQRLQRLLHGGPHGRGVGHIARQRQGTASEPLDLRLHCPQAAPPGVGIGLCRNIRHHDIRPLLRQPQGDAPADAMFTAGAGDERKPFPPGCTFLSSPNGDIYYGRCEFWAVSSAG